MKIRIVSKPDTKKAHTAMDYIRQIQEIVDKHKEEIPVGVVTTIMQSCQNAYNALQAMNPVGETNEGEAAAMFRSVFAEGGLEGEALERRVRERLAGA
jgi:hypothetical protein